MKNDQILDDDFQKGNANLFLDKATVLSINLIKIHLNEDIRHIKNARIALIILAAIAFIAHIVMTTLFGIDYNIIIEGLAITAIYIGCIVGIRYNPQFSLIAVLLIYLLVWITSIFGDFANLYNGILIKVIMVYFLVRGIMGASGHKRRLDQLYKLGLPLHEIEMAKALKELKPNQVPKD